MKAKDALPGVLTDSRNAVPRDLFDPTDVGMIIIADVQDLHRNKGALSLLSAVAAEDAADGLEDDLELVQSDLFENLQGRKFDLIISNPPYVTEEAMQSLPGEYRAEPALALRAGEDGMDVMRRMMPALKEHLS